jgi:hypothetical protein
MDVKGTSERYKVENTPSAWLKIVPLALADALFFERAKLWLQGKDVLPHQQGIKSLCLPSDTAHPRPAQVACWDNPNRLSRKEVGGAQRVRRQPNHRITSSDFLMHFLRAGGALRVLAITNRKSGLCRGFGFAEIADLADVPVALSLLSDALLNRQLTKIKPHRALRNGKARKSAVARQSHV